MQKKYGRGRGWPLGKKYKNKIRVKKINEKWGKK